MFRKNLALIVFLILIPAVVHATDLEHSVSGDSEIESDLENSKVPNNSPYIVNGEPSENVDNNKIEGVDVIFNHGVKEVTNEKVTAKKKYEDFGYTTPGTFSGQENYIDLDKSKIAKDFRRSSTGGVNLSFVKNNYDYQSTDDIIQRTLGEGPKSMKGGALYFRNDSFFLKTDFLNLHWSIGTGVSYSTGKGIFIDGTRSDATFSFWEVPVDLGIGLELQIANWIKAAGTAGPSLQMILQNRSDFERGEKGKRVYQYSPGYFASAQFKINLTNFNDEQAYELFTSSEITNLFLNLEIRHQNFEKFKDDIKISGTSFGLGFTFEYL